MNDRHPQRPVPRDLIGSTDTELVEAHLRGDRSALAAIYDRYADSLYDTAAAMLRDRHEAADVMQEVFLVAAERLGQLRDPARLKPWLFAVLRNEVFRRTKRRSRSRPTDFSGPGAVEVAAVMDPAADGEAVAAAELAVFLRDAARGLDERDQLVLELTARQGLAGADLADALGVGVDQTYVVVHRMRERVERSLGALTVARMGRRECSELGGILSNWDGTFSVVVRKRVARHIDGCDICDRSRKKYAVVALLGASPALAAPPELRDLVLGRSLPVDTPTGRGSDRGAPYGFDERSGFPGPLRRGRRQIVAVLFGAVAGVLLVVGGGIALTGGGDEPPTAEVPTSTAAAPSVTSPSPSTTMPPTTVSPTTVPSTTLSPTTVPPTTVPPTTAPPTTVAPVAVAPPVAPPAPPVTAAPAPTPTTTPAVTVAPTPPPTTQPPAPGRLELSTTTVDLGASSGSSTVTLSNPGQQPVDWNVATNGSPLPFTVSPTAGQLAPGATAQLQVGVNRAGQPEGDLSTLFSVVSSADGGATITALARVEVTPIVAVSGPSTVTICPSNSAAPFRASVTDASPITGVVLSWTGPGAGGSVGMTPNGGGWVGGFTGAVNGTWTVIATATDARGNIGRGSTSIQVIGCR